MGYRFAEGLSACRTSGRLVLLDLRRDRYFGLGPRAEITATALIEALSVPPELGDSIDWLVDSGILLRTDGEDRPELCLPPSPSEHSLLDDDGRVRGRARPLGALGDRLHSHLALHTRGLRRSLQALEAARGAGAVSADLDAARAVARDFAAASLLVRSRDRCLPTSLAVARRLAKRRVAADLVLGVRLRPFAAHSWVQTGSAVVNDHVDTVRSYTPILVV